MATCSEHGATGRCSPTHIQLIMTSSVISSKSEIDNNIKTHVISVDQQEAQSFKKLESGDSLNSTFGINSATPLLPSSDSVCNGTPEVEVINASRASSSSSREDLFYPKIIDTVTATMKPEIVDWLINNSKSANRKSGLSNDSSVSVTSLATNSTDIGAGSETDGHIKIETSSSGYTVGSLVTSNCLATANLPGYAGVNNEKDLSDARLQGRISVTKRATSEGIHEPPMSAKLPIYSKSTIEDQCHVITDNNAHTSSLTWENIITAKTMSVGNDLDLVLIGSSVVARNYDNAESSSAQTSALTWEHLQMGSTMSPDCSEDNSLVITGSSFVTSSIEAVDAQTSSLTVENEKPVTTVSTGYDDVPTGNTLVINYSGMMDAKITQTTSLTVKNQPSGTTVLNGCSEDSRHVTIGNKLLCSVRDGVDCWPTAEQTSSTISSTFQHVNSLSTLIDAGDKVELEMTSLPPSPPPLIPPAVERSVESALGRTDEHQRCLWLTLDVASDPNSDQMTTAACSSVDLMTSQYGSMTSQSSTAAHQHHVLANHDVTPFFPSILDSSTNTGKRSNLHLTEQSAMMTSQSDGAPQRLLLAADVVDVDESPSKSRSRSERNVVKIERIPSTIIARYGRSVSTTLNSSTSSSGCPITDTSSYSFRHAKRINQSMTDNRSRDQNASWNRHVKWPHASVSATKEVDLPRKRKSFEKNEAQEIGSSSPEAGKNHIRVASADGSATLPSKWSTQTRTTMRYLRAETAGRPVRPPPVPRQQQSRRPPVPPIPTRSSALRELHATAQRLHLRQNVSASNTFRYLSQHRPETSQRLTRDHRSISISARSKRSPAMSSSPMTSPCSRSRHQSASDRTGRSSPSPARMRSESTGARSSTKQYPTPTRTSEMRRAFSRMTPRNGTTNVDSGGRVYRDDRVPRQPTSRRRQQHTITSSSRESSRRVRNDITSQIQDQFQHCHRHHHHHHHHHQQQQQQIHRHSQAQQLHQYPPQQHSRKYQQYHDHRSTTDDVGLPQLSSTRYRYSSRTHRDHVTRLDSPTSECVYRHQNCGARGSSRRPTVRTFLVEQTPTVDWRTRRCRSTNSSPRHRHHLWLCSQERRSTTVRYTSTTSGATGSSRWPGEERESWSGLASIHPVKSTGTDRPQQDITTTSTSTLSSKSRPTRFDQCEHCVRRPSGNRYGFSAGNDPLKNRKRAVCARSPPPPFVSPQRIQSAKLRHKLGLASPRSGSPSRGVDVEDATSPSSVDDELTRGERSLTSNNRDRSVRLTTATVPTTRSFRYSRFHRRVIDTVVPDDIRLLPDRWAMRTARLTGKSQSPER